MAIIQQTYILAEGLYIKTKFIWQKRKQIPNYNIKNNQKLE